MTDSDTIYFYSARDAYGFCCQWYESPFVDEDGNRFRNAEAYFMYRKAKLFKDEEIAAQILSLNQHPKLVKELGRQVRGFDEKIWKQNRSNVAYKGNILKFSQNPKLKEDLLMTGTANLVEASSTDRIWGIGFSKERAEANRHRWGLNELGKTLQKVRRSLSQTNK